MTRNRDLPTVQTDRHRKASLIEDVKQNRTIRSKFVLSILVVTAAMILGYNDAQLRPAFPDLIEITKTDLDKGSTILTSYFSGRLFGAVLGGILLSKFNTYLIFTVTLTVDSGAVAGIPWCSVYELMVGIHALHGTLLSVLNVAVTATSIRIWGSTSRGRAYVVVFYLALEVSLALAPIGTAPFLQEKVTSSEVTAFRSTTPFIQQNVTSGEDTAIRRTTPFPEGTCCTGNISSDNDVELHSSTQQTVPSKLYIAYSISAGMTLVVSIPYLILFLTSAANSSGEKTSETSKSLNNLSNVVKYLQMINIGVFSGMYAVIEMCFPQYLMVFCVQYLNWTKTSAALVTSVFSFSRLGGKVAGIFLVRVIKSQTLMVLASLLDTFGFVCLTVSAYTFVDAGVWISACITGLGTSIMWPTALSWIHTYLIPVSGKVSSYVLVVAFVFTLFTPKLLGHLMQEFSLLWFCYVCLIASVVVIINVFFMLLHTKYYKPKCNVCAVDVYTVESTNQEEFQTEVTRL